MLKRRHHTTLVEVLVDAGLAIGLALLLVSFAAADQLPPTSLAA